jgi:ArsR family transcriptional regulator
MSAFFRTIGNPTRLRIVAELVKKEKCVGDVESLTGRGQANISQHLAILKKQGIVDCRKEGNLRCYFLKNPLLLKKILELAAQGN